MEGFLKERYLNIYMIVKFLYMKHREKDLKCYASVFYVLTRLTLNFGLFCVQATIYIEIDLAFIYLF
jgi:hypothetical protein